ncbi:hypothetical protein MBLNU230_g2322t1 [Neophaeotheca triangularis]
MSSSDFVPTAVDLNTADARDIICYLNQGGNEYNGMLGARVSAIFVVLVTSSAVTFFPVAATRVRKLHIPHYVYLFARYFGSGVIVATAFMHLLAPAYESIGGDTCVGMTGGWALYDWVPCIILTSVMVVFLLDFAAERYVEVKYGSYHGDEEGATHRRNIDPGQLRYTESRSQSVGHQALHSGDQDRSQSQSKKELDADAYSDETDSVLEDRGFKQQIAGFLILEFGVIFHSVIIGLTLGTAGDEFNVLYPVIVFHQAFEGLGIGARMSSIPFPKRLNWLPWVLCAAYGLTTPIAIAIGLGVRTTYNGDSYTANVVSGVLDAVSAGILIYTGLVELLARDFLYNPQRTRDNKQLAFMVCSVLLGAGLMALLGKWA